MLILRDRSEGWVRRVTGLPRPRGCMQSGAQVNGAHGVVWSTASVVACRGLCRRERCLFWNSPLSFHSCRH